MSQSHRPTVNLLCLSEENSSRHRSQSVAIALAQIGWQVNLFVRARTLEATAASWITPHCQVVKLATTAAVADTAKTIETAQRKVGLSWPLLHTFDDLGAQVGAFVKAAWGWRWLHTPDTLSHTADMDADQVIAVVPKSAVADFSIDEVSQMRRQRQRSQDSPSDDWVAIARRLDVLYRQHLALHIGATAISLPQEISIPLPMAVPECERVPVARSA